MTMNIYINVENIERLSKEENKSGLINKLLDDYYGSKTDYPKVKVPLGEVTNGFPLDPMPQIIKTPGDIAKIIKPQGTILCKIHATPLTENGKCLQKGCKYA